MGQDRTVIRLRITAVGPAVTNGAYAPDNTHVYTFANPELSISVLRFANGTTNWDFIPLNPPYQGGVYLLENAAIAQAAFLRAIDAARRRGTLQVRIWWSGRYYRFYRRILEQMAFTADDTHNFADPLTPGDLTGTFTRVATKASPKDTNWRVTLEQANAGQDDFAVNLAAYASRTDGIAATVHIDLPTSGLGPPQQLAALGGLIAADWKSLLDSVPPSPQNLPPECVGWRDNIRQYMLHYVSLTRGQTLMDRARDAGERAFGGAAADNALDDTERQVRVVRAIRDEVDRFLITANPWGDDTNVGDYPAAIHVVLAVQYKDRFRAMPISIMRDLPGNPLNVAQMNRLVAQVGMANCGEHANLTFAVIHDLMNRNPAIATLLRCAVLSGYANIDHAFVVGGEKPEEVIQAYVHVNDHGTSAHGASKPVWDPRLSLARGPRTPGRRGWICDPYLALGEIDDTLAELCSDLADRSREWLDWRHMHPPPAVNYVLRMDQANNAHADHIHVNGFCDVDATITAIAPASGPAVGGTQVTITGTHFEAGAGCEVTIGNAATEIDGRLGRQLLARTAATAAAAVNTVVRHPVEDNRHTIDVSLNNSFTYEGPPTITALDVNAGSTLGGTAVRITGTSFVNGAQVRVGGVQDPGATWVDAQTITITTPPRAAAGAVELVVRNPDGQEARLDPAFTYNDSQAPTVAQVDPGNGPSSGGTDVTITGTNFAAGAKVTFDGREAAGVNVQNDTTIAATTPAHAAVAVRVLVQNADAKSGGLDDAFTYDPAAGPTITNVDPAVGPSLGGTVITITGENFVPNRAATRVQVGGVEATAVTVQDGTTISATTGAGAAAQVGVTVINPDDQQVTRANAFTYQPSTAPTVTGIIPAEGPAAGGTNVTVQGTGFVAGARLLLGAAAADVIAVPDAQTIQATTANAVAGTVNIVVRNPDGQEGRLGNGFRYKAAPTIDNLSTVAGPSLGRTDTTITGTGFAAGVRVFFGGTEARATFRDATTIDVVTPGHPAGAVEVRVLNADGSEVTANAAFTYAAAAAPTIVALDVNTGPTWGNTAVVITGTNFQPDVPGTSVLFDGTAATKIVVVDNATIRLRTPSGAAAQVNVILRNPDGQHVTLNNGFTYAAQLAPTVTGVAPNSGPLAGGTRVTISGTNFATDGSEVKVFFGAKGALNVAVTDATTLTADTPQGAALRAVRVRVRNPDNQNGDQNNAFTYV